MGTSYSSHSKAFMEYQRSKLHQIGIKNGVKRKMESSATIRTDNKRAIILNSPNWIFKEGQRTSYVNPTNNISDIESDSVNLNLSAQNNYVKNEVDKMANISDSNITGDNINSNLSQLVSDTDCDKTTEMVTSSLCSLKKVKIKYLPYLPIKIIKEDLSKQGIITKKIQRMGRKPRKDHLYLITVEGEHFTEILNVKTICGYKIKEVEEYHYLINESMKIKQNRSLEYNTSFFDDDDIANVVYQQTDIILKKCIKKTLIELGYVKNNDKNATQAYTDTNSVLKEELKKLVNQIIDNNAKKVCNVFKEPEDLSIKKPDDIKIENSEQTEDFNQDINLENNPDNKSETKENPPAKIYIQYTSYLSPGGVEEDLLKQGIGVINLQPHRSYDQPRTAWVVQLDNKTLLDDALKISRVCEQPVNVTLYRGQNIIQCSNCDKSNHSTEHCWYPSKMSKVVVKSLKHTSKSRIYEDLERQNIEIVTLKLLSEKNGQQSWLLYLHPMQRLDEVLMINKICGQNVDIELYLESRKSL